MDCIQRKMEENQSEHAARQLESGQLLDIRADRIQKLEKYDEHRSNEICRIV
jgi:hypothetical protein